MTQPANVDARAVLIESLYANAETRAPLLSLIKKAHPQAPIPELDARDAIRAEIDPAMKELRAEREALKNERNQRWLDQQRDGIKHMVGEANIPAVEKLMTEEAIGNHRAAAELWQARQQVAAPSVPMRGPLAVPGLHGAGGDEYKGILSDPQWANKKAYETLNDIRSGNTAKWAPFAG